MWYLMLSLKINVRNEINKICFGNIVKLIDRDCLVLINIKKYKIINNNINEKRLIRAWCVSNYDKNYIKYTLQLHFLYYKM